MGYQNIYTNLKNPTSKKKPDPRIAALQKSGLDWRWLRIADQVGYEQFIAMWIMFSDLFGDDRSSIRMHIPNIEKLSRVQRDMLIFQLSSAGHGPKDIRLSLKSSFGIKISEQNISMILGRSKT